MRGANGNRLEGKAFYFTKSVEPASRPPEFDIRHRAGELRQEFHVPVIGDYISLLTE